MLLIEIDSLLDFLYIQMKLNFNLLILRNNYLLGMLNKKKQTSKKQFVKKKNLKKFLEDNDEAVNTTKEKTFATI